MLTVAYVVAYRFVHKISISVIQLRRILTALCQIPKIVPKDPRRVIDLFEEAPALALMIRRGGDNGSGIRHTGQRAEDG
jgi:hypothetical protein